jgi:hypothetical protein
MLNSPDMRLNPFPPLDRHHGKDEQGRHYREYRGRQCGDCPLRGKCTESPRGRKLKRDEGEEIRES